MSRFALILLLSLAGTAGAHDNRQPRELSVDGKASQLVAPDIADIQLTLHGRAPSGDSALNQVGGQAQQLIDALRKLDTPIDIQATDVQLRQVVKGTERSWRQDGSEPVEMLAIRNLTLQRIPIAVLPDVMRTLAQQPLARIDRVNTRFQNTDELIDSLTLQAIDDATARAKRMAQQLGVKLGLPLSVRSGSNRPSPEHYPVMRAMAMSDDAGGGMSSTGQQTIEANVSIVFELAAP